MGTILAREDPLEEEMATHSRVLAWRIPRTGEPGGLPFMGSQKVGHNLAPTEKVLIVLYKFLPKHYVFLWARDLTASSLQGSLTLSYSWTLFLCRVLGSVFELLWLSLCWFISRPFKSITFAATASLYFPSEITVLSPTPCSTSGIWLLALSK